MKYRTIFTVFLLIFLNACIPHDIKKEMEAGMKMGNQMMADEGFKKAVALIELHKIRNGKYPESLDDLEFLGALDSMVFDFVEYRSMDSVYELNLNQSFPSLNGTTTIEIKYPKEFWNGLGCVKSNTR